MDREQILQILYEMALITGGETHVEPLIVKTLQRLLYHTDFSCGIYLSAIKTNDNNEPEACIEQVVGCGVLLQNKGNILRLPEYFIQNKAGLFTDAGIIKKAFGKDLKYKVALKLPVTDDEFFLLLSIDTSEPEISFERIFDPVLRNFGKTLKLCRENENYTSILEREIERRERLEASLRESETFLLNIIDTVPARIFWKDTNSVYLGCNNLFANDAGINSAEDIIGKTDFDLPWGPNISEAFRLDDQSVMKSGKGKILYEEPQIRKDGEECWLETSKVPITNVAGDVVGVLGTYSDITRRKTMELSLRESETRHRAVFESTVDSIINIDDRGIIESVNPATEKLFGYSSTELIGKNISMLMPESYASMHDHHIGKYVNTGGITVLGMTRELFAQKKDGSIFPVDIALDEMIINDQRMFTGIIRDITNIKETEKKLVAAKEIAERANKAKSDFLSSMSHELRTPLNAIIGFSQLIRMEQGLTSDLKDNIKEIYTAGYHLLALINEVLDLSKIEAGHINLTIEPVAYSDLITECISLVYPIAQTKDIRITSTACNGNIVIKCDRVRIKQVIVNLLSNAIKYNRKGGEVVIDITPAAAGFHRINIKDNGFGIKNENISGLFQAFNRLGAEHTDIEGTGIGLVITKRLVELMAGNIGVESEYGIGSNFWIELPVDSASPPLINEPDLASAGLIKQFTNEIYNVLYIEDNPSNLKLVSRLLSHKKHIRLYTAHTPSLGLELAKIKKPNLILLDIEMPEMNGFQVLNALREETITNTVSVIAVSANALPVDIIEAKAAGFDDYITKPIEMDEFYLAIDNALFEQ